jgi:hypothetical protein
MTKTVKPLESMQIADPTAPHRCAFRDRQGNRCRLMLPDADFEFCASHARCAEKRKQAEAAKIAAELLDHCDDLQSVQGIHNAFANLFKLFAAKKIARADAFLLAYIIRSLVRTALVLDKGPAPGEKGGVNIVWKNWDLPQREPVASPSASSDSVPVEQANSSASGPSVDAHDSAAALPPGADQLRLPASPPPQPFPSKPQTEFPLDEHPWGSYAARAPLRRFGPKYRGF